MEAAAAGEHLGIAGMRDRAQRAGGKLEITSEPGRGTTVSVSLPIRETPGTLHRAFPVRGSLVHLRSRTGQIPAGSALGSSSRALQNRDAVSLTSAPAHAFANRCSTAAASAVFPCAFNAAASPNSDQPFSGNRFRSSR